MKKLMPIILLFCSVFANAASPPAPQSPRPLPKGCIRSGDDLKSPETQETLKQIDFVANPPAQKPKVNGWNQLVGEWTLAEAADETATATIAVDNDGLSGTIIQKNTKTGALTAPAQSGKIAICSSDGRLEIWMLDSSREKGNAVILLLRSNIAGRIDFTPMTGKYKDLPLAFQKGKLDASALAKTAPASR